MRGNILVDEVDSILNVMQEMCYSWGKPVSPNPEATEIIIQLYRTLLQDPKLSAQYAFECAKNTGKEAKPLSPDNAKAFSSLLIERFKKNLPSFTLPNNASLQKKIRTHPFDTEKLTWYLSRDSDHLKEAQQYFDQLDEVLQDFIALVGEELSHLLPESLQSLHNKKYGLGTSVIPCPFSAAQTPKEGFKFASDEVTTNYTIQTYLIEGIPTSILEKVIESLRREYWDEKKGNREIVPENTAAYQKFRKLQGNALHFPLFNIKPEEFCLLHDKINHSIDEILYCVENFILPMDTRYEGKLSCTPMDFTSFFTRKGKFSGFTGTLWNASSMHRDLVMFPEKGTDAKTLYHLHRMKDAPVHIIDDLLKEMSEKGVDMIIDSGGYLRKKPIEEEALRLSKLTSKPVIFFTATGKKCVARDNKVIPHSETQLNTGESLTLLDDCHTTGCDVPQRPQAIGVVTIGKGMLMRDLFQAVWRLREIDREQKVCYALNREVRDLIRQTNQIEPTAPITFFEILTYTINNQQNSQEQHSYQAFKHELWSLPKMLLFDFSLSKDIKEQLVTWMKKHQLWMQNTQLPSRMKFGQLVTPQETPLAAAKEIERFTQALKELSGIISGIDTMTEEANRAYTARQKVMPKSVTSNVQTNSEMQMQVEVATQTQLNLDQQTDLHQGKQIKLGVCTSCLWMPKTFSSIPDEKESGPLSFIPLRACISFEPNLFILGDYLDQIHLNMNVLEWNEGNYGQFRLFGPYRTPFKYFLIEDSKITLLSCHEVTHCESMKQLYRKDLGFLRDKRDLTSKGFHLLCLIKLLDGDADFTPSELKEIAHICKKVGRENLRILFEKTILIGLDQKAQNYRNTPLFKLLHNL